MLAELLIGNPGCILLVSGKRQSVNEHRFPFVELNIIGRRIFKYHAKSKRYALDFDGGKCCIFKLAETPFIGV